MSESNNFWRKTIWDLNVSPKIKHFVWKGCSRSLPMSLNLHQRGVRVGIWCSKCEEDVESESRVLFDCDQAINF